MIEEIKEAILKNISKISILYSTFKRKIGFKVLLIAVFCFKISLILPELRTAIMEEELLIN